MNTLRMGASWRASLMRECGFYVRACRNARQVIRGRLYGEPFGEFALRKGARLGFPKKPPWEIFQDNWRYKVYTRYMPPGPSPRVVVDIGANLGFFTLFAATRWPEASIYANEPAPENAAWLERNAASVHGDIRVHAYAVAGETGEAPFYLKQDGGWHSLWGAGSESRVQVKTVGLEQVVGEIGETIDFLKMDCEGAEYEILGNASQLLANRVGYVAMEYHEDGSHKLEQLLDIFGEARFRCRIEGNPQWSTGMLYALNSRGQS